MHHGARDPDQAADAVRPLDWSWAVDAAGNIELNFHHSPQKKLVPASYPTTYGRPAKKRPTDLRPPLFRSSTLRAANVRSAYYPPSPPKTPPEHAHPVRPLSRRNTAPAKKSKFRHGSDRRAEIESKALEIRDPCTAFSKLDIIKSWLRECNGRHDCQSHGFKPNPTFTGPLWLIDVEDDCIVPGSTSQRYATLSYVHGQVRSRILQLMDDNRRILQRPGVLREQNCVFEIPRTFRQAMNISRMLGERYLWVDALCIVHDDEDSKRTQISAMASIFANSAFTLAAAGGSSADHGLLETGDITAKRERKARVPRHETDHRVQDIHNHLLERSEWSQRGWTFQEQVFSKRIICFFQDKITWECQRAVWDDACPVQSCTRQPYQESYFPKTPSFQDPCWPDMEQYGRLVKDYNRRHLTHASDILPAFEGTLSALSKFSGGFLYGIPAQFLDVALLWQPLQLLNRRKAQPRCDKQDALPSWSWVAWEGELDLNIWTSHYDRVHREASDAMPNSSWLKTSVQIRPVVRWHTLDHQNNRTRVFSSTQHSISSNSDNYGGETLRGSQYHTNQSSSDEDCEISYPHTPVTNTISEYPISIADSPTKILSPPRPALITCKTHRAFFKIGARCWAPHKCLSVDILDQNGTWAGTLRLNQRRFDIVPELRSSARWELIAISKGSAENAASEAAVLEEWNNPRRPRDGTLYEFYNVMWIGWKGKVAYRKAVGRIMKRAWRAADREVVNVVLG